MNKTRGKPATLRPSGTQSDPAPLAEASARSAGERLHELQVRQIELEMQNEELRRAQVVIEEMRDRYVDLYEYAPVGYFTLTREGIVASANLTATKLLEVERKKLLNRRFAGFIAPGDAGRWHRHFLNVLQRDGRQSCELMLLRGDGSVFHAQLNSLKEGDPLSSHETDDPARPDEKANDAALLRITLTDITERKHAEAEMRIASIAFESQDGLMVTDVNGIILRVNRAFTNITGYSPEDVVGKTPAILQSGLQDKAFYQRMWATLKQEHFWQGELMNKHKDGNIYVERLTISAVLAPDGSTTHYVGSLSDFTEQKGLEAEVADRRNDMELLQQQHIAAQTAAAIAHELNQPLLAIASYSEAALMLLKAEKPDLDKIGMAIEGSEKQAHRAGKSIRELLDFLSMKEFPTEAFDLNEEILGVLNAARTEHELQFHSSLRLEKTLPFVRANRTHVQKALFNLLYNSIDAMHEAGVPLPAITVTVQTKKDESIAQVTIQDNGPGVKREDIQRLFEPFFTTKATGIGMGLAISRSLIEENGGQLWIDPQEGPGATFHLTLPFAS